MSRKKDPVPVTLAEAREVLGRRRPKQNAEPRVWVAFHRRCAEVYGRVAEVDVAHRFEALAYAGQEIRRAGEIEEQLADS